MPCGDIHIHLGQHYFRWWLVASQHQTISWTNVDLSSVRSCGIHMWALFKKYLYIPISKTRWKIAFVKKNPDLPGANALQQLVCCNNHSFILYLFVVDIGLLSRDHFVNVPSQWETMLQCNIVSHWLGAYTKSSLLSPQFTPPPLFRVS